MRTIVLFVLLFPALVFSQEIVSKNLDLSNGKVKLPGTLSYPKTTGEIPLVIFIHGSGNIDRNGNQAGTFVKANYIKTLADSLNTRGIACYRYDKRTATKDNTPFFKHVTLDDFAKDAKVAIDYFTNNELFNSIHLIGHSQGSLVAMSAITDAVSDYISIAGAGQSIDKTIIEQLNKQSLEMGKIAKDHLEELVKTDTILRVHPFLMQLFAPKNQKFLKDWISIDPTLEIKKITIPTLIINGDFDIQVSTTDAEKLHEALPGSRLEIIPHMNHVLKMVYSMEENQKSYTDEAFPLSSKLVETVSSFIKNMP